MGSFSLIHWVIVIGVIVLLFGRGKISDLMGDVAKGIKTFKKGMAEDDTEAKSQPQPQTIEHDTVAPMAPDGVEKKAKVG
jgi:sec-independent protein translocase protein TatA